MNDSNEKKNNNLAVALKYKEDEDTAPKVIAKGENKVADRIIEKGEELSIPIYRDEKLSQQLKNLELEETIPPELYEAVAQVLIFISRIDENK